MPHSTSSGSPSPADTPDVGRRPVRVVVVDDHALLRDTIRHLLVGVPDM